MLGRAYELKTMLVHSCYEYPNNDYSVSNRRWVDLDESINKALQKLGGAEILSIKHTSQSFSEGDLHETALIIYKEAIPNAQ